MEEHHRITGGSRPTVLVNEKHFTSIIAYALSCEQYRAKLQLLKPDTVEAHPEQGQEAVKTTIFKVPPKSFSSNNDESAAKVGHWLTVTSNSGDHLESKQPSHRREKSLDFNGSDEGAINNKSLSHVDVEFHDGATKFFCKVN